MPFSHFPAMFRQIASGFLALLLLSGSAAAVVSAGIGPSPAVHTRTGTGSAHTASAPNEPGPSRPSTPPAPHISSNPNPNQTATPRVATHSIVFIGDSLTAGAFAGSRAKSFPYVAARDLGMSFAVTNATYGVTAVYTAQKMRTMRSVIPSDARYIVIELGTNDVAQTSETWRQFRAAYDEILTRTHAAAPTAKFICLGVWRNGIHGQPASGYAHNQVIAGECAKFGGTFVGLSDLYNNGALRGPAGHPSWFGKRTDDFHPNSAGHARIAARVAAAIRAS